jgi:hypothetical protein
MERYRAPAKEVFGMAKRMAITIAGAVSLGSYEAGVTYELLEALRWHNSQASEDDKIYVDVITGASAGGMTAAMLGKWLMFHGDAMQSADENPLYLAWVKKVSLKGLMRLSRNDDKWASICSSNCVTDLGTEMLVTPITGPFHACIAPSKTLRIGMALSNLNGVDYQIPITGNDDGGFNYTRSVDQRLFVVRSGKTDGLTLLTPDGAERDVSWDVMRDAAVACGAFPFAFRPQQVQRDQDEYVSDVTPLGPARVPPDDPKKTYVLSGDGTKWSFAYTDGGVLQNQPLGIAKTLVDAEVTDRLALAKAHLVATTAVSPGSDAAAAADHAVGQIYRDSAERIYVFISPHAVRNSSTSLDATQLGLRRILPEIIRVYLRQAAFHDWIMAERTNRDIRLLDQRAEDLAKALEEGKIRNIECFLSSADNLDDLMLKGSKDATLARLRHQYHQLYEHLMKVDNGSQLAQTFLSGIAALEAAAQLHDRDAMNIIAVLANGPKELAGSGIFAFVGFFSERFREHDYWVGRKKAQAYLSRQDVCTLLGIDQNAMQKYLSEHLIKDFEPALSVPLKWTTMLRAGGRWLLHSLLIRWEILGVVAIIVALIFILGIVFCHLIGHL